MTVGAGLGVIPLTRSTETEMFLETTKHYVDVMWPLMTQRYVWGLLEKSRAIQSRLQIEWPYVHKLICITPYVDDQGQRPFTVH